MFKVDIKGLHCWFWRFLCLNEMGCSWARVLDFDGFRVRFELFLIYLDGLLLETLGFELGVVIWWFISMSSRNLNLMLRFLDDMLLDSWRGGGFMLKRLILTNVGDWNRFLSVESKLGHLGNLPLEDQMWYCAFRELNAIW